MILDIRTTADIHASAEAVWQALTDLSAYPDWNPFITRASGTIDVGERLELRIEPPGAFPRTVRPLVVEVDPNRELGWVERQRWLPGWLDAHHWFTITSRGENRTHVVHRETFTGLGVFINRGYLTNIREGLEAMNRALKARAQGGKGPGL